MIPESARAEFPADHERVPKKNRGLESVPAGAQWGTFQVRNEAQWGSPRGRRRRVTSNRRPLPCQGSSRLPTSSDLLVCLLTCSGLAKLVKTGQSPSICVPTTFSATLLLPTGPNRLGCMSLPQEFFKAVCVLPECCLAAEVGSVRMTADVITTSASQRSP
jgi:hypothetical protein